MRVELVPNVAESIELANRLGEIVRGNKFKILGCLSDRANNKLQKAEGIHSSLPSGNRERLQTVITRHIWVSFLELADSRRRGGYVQF